VTRPSDPDSRLDASRGDDAPVGAVAVLDGSWRFTFANFSTLFLLVALFTVPLHLVYNYVFRDVVAVREIASDVARFPDQRLVRGVGPQRLEQARLGYIGLNVLELALTPLLVRASRRVAEVHREDGVPGVSDALRGPRSSPRGARPPAAALITAAVLALALGVLVEASGNLIAEPVGPAGALAAVAAVQALARAAAAPFFLGVAARV